MFASRMEDLTEPELIRTNPLTNRTVCLYGYVRGCPIKADTPIHIPGKYIDVRCTWYVQYRFQAAEITS